jgi:septal ring factor EnvC (AmiA/AmiB activator)
MVAAAVRWLVPLLASAMVAGATAYGAVAVERDHNAQTRTDVAELQKAVVPDAAWKAHVEEHLKNVDASLERIEHAVGSK